MSAVGKQSKKGSTDSTEIDKEKIKVSVCQRCSSTVKKEDKGVGCDICGNWYHIQCEGLSVEEYKIMIKEESKCMHWFCKDCETNTLSTGKILMQLRQSKRSWRKKCRS